MSISWEEKSIQDEVIELKKVLQMDGHFVQLALIQDVFS